MEKRLVIWKPIWSKNAKGKMFLNPYLLDLIEYSYRGTLLDEILAMKPQTPISLSAAANLVHEKYHEAITAGRIGPMPGQNRWYCEHFTQWIAEQGFHIEITGDEFEPGLMSSQLA